jgi:hypothetical protein
MGRLRGRYGQRSDSGKGHQSFSHGIHLSELNKTADKQPFPKKVPYFS